ncbi:hypothetical protein GCM10011331_07590 [Flavimobilis marinus]|uniref:Uncharacterized protein n=1 Tax=Flavimobilis marinus TaxID=285351 RepID=A0A1I2CRI5_9MICO|nr:hypothetical protein [Flavimobilis marinus]GHG47084.1 hypothetical protein GCM10011331_07590 [Flavimobilis marinus]SFE70858.1 hypothetical protein SAMN04488035_0234 [Flavimobilis marinus]
MRTALADYLRYLVALLLGFGVVNAAINGVLPGGAIVDIVIGWLRIVGWFALAGLLGHLVPTWLRGVSVTRSSLLMLPAMVVVLALMDLSAGWEAVQANVILGMLLLTPVIVIAHVLRLVVPPLRPHVDGKPVRYAMSGAGEPGRS